MVIRGNEPQIVRIRRNEHTLVRIRWNEYIKSSQKLEWGNEHITYNSENKEKRTY